MLQLVLCVACVAVSSTGPDNDMEIVRLKVGTEIAVSLDRDTFDEGIGIWCERVDDGSRLFLRWDQMLAEDMRRIRGTFGYLPDEPEAIMVPAVKVVTTRGDEFLGLIVEQDQETFKLRQGTRVYPLRWSGIRSRENVMVDALEVYDGEEFYARRLSESVPQSALEHYNMALFCESLQLWQRVTEHLGAVQQEDPDFKTSVVTDKLKRAALRLEAGEESEILMQVTRLGNRELYDKALEIVEGFLEERPGSSLRGEFVRARSRLLKQRQKWLTGKVTANFFAHLDRFALKLASDQGLTLRDCVKQMEKEASDVALERVAAQLKADLEEVTAIWQDPERIRASVRTCSYGAGTFTLGEERVFADLQKQEPGAGSEESEEGSKAGAGEDESVQDRIKRMLEERKKAAEKKKKESKKKKDQPKFKIQDVPPNKDEWWAAEKVQFKKQYLMAYWAEKDPHVRIVKITPRECVRCGGLGVLRKIAKRGESGTDPCDRCKSLRIDRVIRFN